MKVKKTLLIVFILTFLCISSQLKIQAEFDKYLELSFPEITENIKEIIWQRIKVEEKLAESLGISDTGISVREINYPKVIISENNIYFIQNNNVQKTIKYGSEINKYLTISPNRKKIGVYTVNIINDKNKGIGVVQSTTLNILNLDGKLELSKNFSQNMQFAIDDYGNYVAIGVSDDGIGGRLYFYDKNNYLMKEVRPFSSGFFTYQASFNYSCDKFVICFDKFGQFGGEIIIYSKQGVELYRKKIVDNNDDTIISQLAISPSNDYFYYHGAVLGDSGFGYISSLMDFKGNTVFVLDYGKFGTFSPDGKYISLSSRNEIDLYSIDNNRYVWKKVIKNDSFSINNVAISYDYYPITAISIANIQMMEEKSIIVFDTTGQISLTQPVKSDKSLNRIILQFDNNTNILYAINGNKILIYYLVGELS